MLKLLKSAKVRILAAGVVVAALLMSFSPIDVNISSPLTSNRINLKIGYVRIAMASGNMDYPLTQVGIQAALNALPATGGRLNLMSTSGTVTFTGTVSRAIPNVTIVGTGNVPLLQNNGVTALFNVGGQTGWVFRDLSTDAGGITLAADTVLENVHLGATYYALRTTGSYSTGRGATYVIASANATAIEKANADVVVDGTADDVQIQAAIYAVSTTVPNIIQLTEGYFYITSPIVAGGGTSDYSGLTIKGAGSGKTFIQVVGNLGGNPIDIRGAVGAHKNNITLEGFTIIGNQSDTTASIAGIRLDYIDYPIVQDVVVKNMGNPTTDTQGIAFGFNQLRYGFFDNLIAQDYTHYGVSLTQVDYSQFGKMMSLHSSTFPTPANGGNHGVYVNNSSNNTFGQILVTNLLSNTDFDGLEIISGSQENVFSNVVINGSSTMNDGIKQDPGTSVQKDNSFGNVLVNGFNYGWGIGNGANSTSISNLTINNPTLDGLTTESGGAVDTKIGKIRVYQAGRRGIYWNTSGLSISQIDIQESQQTGVYLDQYGTNVKITGGVIKNNSRLTNNTYDGISVNHTSSGYLMVSGVQFVNDISGNGQRYGIYSIGDYNTYGSGNYFNGNKTSPIYTVGTHDNNQVIVPVVERLESVLALNGAIRTGEDLSVGLPITFTITNQVRAPMSLAWSFSHTNITAFSFTVVGVDARGRSVTTIKTQADGYTGNIYPPLARITSITMTSRTGTGVGDTGNITGGVYYGLSQGVPDNTAVYQVIKNGSPTTLGTLIPSYSSTGVTMWQPDGGVTTGDNFTVSYRALNNAQ